MASNKRLAEETSRANRPLRIRFSPQRTEMTPGVSSGATQKIGRLELYLEATQASLPAAEGETSAVRAMLADADARVAALEAQLQALHQVTNGTAAIVNARGTSLADCLQDIPNHTRLIASHGVRQGALTTLATVQTQLGHELWFLQLIFPEGEDQADFEELVDELDEVSRAIGDVVDADSVVNKRPGVQQLCQYAGYHADTDAKKRDRFRRGLNTKLKERLNLARADTYNELVNMAITQEDCIMAHRAEKKRKAPAGPSSAQPPRYRIVQNTAPTAPPRARSQEDGLPDPHSSQAWYDPRCLHRMVRGPFFSSLFDLAPRIAVSNAGVPATSHENALSLDSPTKVKDPTRTPRTGARDRPCKSSKDGLTSPRLQSFLKEPQ
ncbi:polyprotein [Panicum miliaceum]|uniref:Polyprotein n=1 Tax=Panicum miliaceum TaxID=4540 RepID=A0A3L6PG99_PANMI|nr:polyprotein [Panicum miliaceum]